MAIVFTAVWTPAGGSPTTLGDVSAKYTIQIEQLGGQCQEQLVNLFASANPARIPRGNVAGDCVFSSVQSYATRAAAAADFKAKFGLLGATGSLVLTMDATTLTMANATYRAVHTVKVEGLRWTMRHTFGITTIT